MKPTHSAPNASPTAATWYAFLNANPGALERLARSLARAWRIPPAHRAEIVEEASQEAAVSLLRRPFARTAPWGLAQAVVRTQMRQVLDRCLRGQERREALRQVAAPQVHEVDVPDLDLLRRAAGEYLRYLQAEADMPEADAAAKAATLGVTAGSFRSCLYRARRRCRTALAKPESKWDDASVHELINADS